MAKGKTRTSAGGGRQRPTTKQPKATSRAKKRRTAHAEPKSRARPRSKTAAATDGGRAIRALPRTAPNPLAQLRAVVAARCASSAPTASGLAADVGRELRRRDAAAPDVELVHTLASVAAGYRRGPAADPPWPTALDLDARVAEVFVDLYWVGGRLPDPERRKERRGARTWIGYSLEQYGLGAGGATARDTLTAVALGAWRTIEPREMLRIKAGLVAGWYWAGLGRT